MNSTSYDIIGDIHGHAEALKQLFRKLGYQEKHGIWQHPNRRIIFVGDYIDRGPAIRETLAMVKSMVDSGNAIALMGNHEFNALGYHTAVGQGDYLRRHSEKNNKQHEQTLIQFEKYQGEWEMYLQWFYTLPLFLETAGLRAVHACWDDEHITWLKQNGYSTLDATTFLREAHRKGSKPYNIIEDILKGKEMDVPCEWLDKDGIPRRKSRIKWWKDPKGLTHGEFLFHCPGILQEEFVDEKINLVLYPKEAPPVFIGHYWLNDELPVIQSHNVACLDYSIAKEGKLVAYRWDGEKELDNSKMISVS